MTSILVSVLTLIQIGSLKGTEMLSFSFVPITGLIESTICANFGHPAAVVGFLVGNLLLPCNRGKSLDRKFNEMTLNDRILVQMWPMVTVLSISQTYN